MEPPKIYIYFARAPYPCTEPPTVCASNSDGVELVSGEWFSWQESDGHCSTCGAAPHDCHDYQPTTWYSDPCTSVERPTDDDYESTTYYFKIDDAFIAFIKDKLGDADEVDLCEANELDDYLERIGITV